MVKDARSLTPAEFEVLEVLWSGLEPQSVAQVLGSIRDKRQVAYTTVMTVLDKLSRKGSVSRVKHGKAYLYSPLVNRDEVLHFLIEEFAGHYFGGNRGRLGSFVGKAETDSSVPVPQVPVEPLDVSLL